jgi:hypothetical protein
MDEIGLHERYYFTRSRISGQYWIQGLWFPTERNDKPPARSAGFSTKSKEFLFIVFYLGRGKSKRGERKTQENEPSQQHPTTAGFRFFSEHLRSQDSCVYRLRPTLLVQ